MTNAELMKIFNETYPEVAVSDYRPLSLEFIKDKEGITIWTENGDIIQWFPNNMAIEALQGRDTNVPSNDLISRQDAIDAFEEWVTNGEANMRSDANALMYERLKNLPSTQPEGYVKIPETGIDDLSDGYHTFRQLYYQRMMLFATIVKQNKEKAWKSLRHEDGELCFGGGWFIVGIDTPEGSYTYHYEDNFYSMFDCKELERARHWDGHTENDVTRLLSLPSSQPETFEWCHDCKEYDQEQHCCHRWSQRIRKTIEELEANYPQDIKDELQYWKERAAQLERDYIRAKEGKPERKGEWINEHWDGDYRFQTDGRGNCWKVVECSVCNVEKKGSPTNFCPNCGAEMKGEKEGEDDE